MRWLSIFLLGSLCHAFLAPGETLNSALARSDQLQRSGQHEEALLCLREARVEYPESVALLFAIGGAEAALGDHLLAGHDLVGARKNFEGARETFGRCVVEPRFAPGAAYNAATCLLRVDAVLVREKDYEARVETLNAAVAAFVEVVDSWPDHPRARRNLDHARYRLALLLQNPPGESEEDEEKNEEKEQPRHEVVGATTQIPDATVDVEEGAIVVLRTKPRSEVTP